MPRWASRGLNKVDRVAYSTFFMQSDLSEIVVSERAFSTFERDLLMTYLHLKYTES